MDFEKIRTDFEKRYEKKCESIYFTGKKVEFFQKNGQSVSASLTVGEAMAVAKRGDGKINLQFSGRDDMLSFSVYELFKNRKEPMAEILIKANELGIKTEGADIFIFKNTGITNLFEPLIIGGLSGFCQNVPPKEKLIPMFGSFGENIKTLSGRKGCFLIFDGQKCSYKPFFGGKYKVVLIYDPKGKPLKNTPEKPSFDEGVSAISKGDAETLCKLLDKDTERFLERQKETKAHRLYSAIKESGDASGCGIMDDGDLFAIVENGNIDSLIRNTTASFKKRFGGKPDFYVTDFADSGFFVKSDN